MEKTSIKPLATEIVYKNNGTDTHFDAFVYNPSGSQEKNLGSLYIIGKVKYGEEDLAYLVNLIASLARREYYSQITSASISSKSAFEHALKKLNEVLEDFFQKKSLKLVIGIAAVAGEDIFVSRIGNIRLSLARDGRHIDVINNVGLFNQEHIEEKEFANVISGKLQPEDKLFMYLPFRSILSREKIIKDTLQVSNQSAFAEKIQELSKKSTSFACCGIHVEFGKIKEIPVEISPSYYTSAANSRVGNTTNSVLSSDHEVIEDKTNAPTEVEPTKPIIIPADVSLAHRKSPKSFLSGLFKKRVSRRLFIPRSKGFNFKSQAIMGTGGLIVLVGAVYLFVFSGSGTDKEVVAKAKKDLQSARSYIGQSNEHSARSLLQASLSSLAQFDTKRANETKAELANILKSLDKTSNKQATLVANISTANLTKIISGDKTYVSDIKGKVSIFDSTTISSFGNADVSSVDYLLDMDPYVAIIDKVSVKLTAMGKKSAKASAYTLKNIDQSQSVAVYEGNLYVLNNDSIIKYTDAATAESKPSVWSKDTTANGLSIAADGNIYILTNDGKIISYFKGAKEKEFDLGLSPSSDTTLYTHKDLPFLYITDKVNKKITVVDKSSGTISISYSLENVGSIADVAIAKDQGISILSTDGKIWSIK